MKRRDIALYIGVFIETTLDEQHGVWDVGKG